MTGEVLLDTNVLVYAYDRSEPVKQRRALEVLDRLAASGAGALTTQVLAEFFVTVTRKLASPLSNAQAAESLRNYVLSWQVIDMRSLVLLEATRGVLKHKFNFWDAQIWAAARLNQIALVFSEDFNSGSVIEGVRFVDPFLPDFRTDQWVH